MEMIGITVGFGDAQVRYEVARSTIRKTENLLSTTLSERWSGDSITELNYQDRDPLQFKKILEYMEICDEEGNVPSSLNFLANIKSTPKLQAIYDEAAFFGMQGLCRYITNPQIVPTSTNTIQDQPATPEELIEMLEQKKDVYVDLSDLFNASVLARVLTTTKTQRNQGSAQLKRVDNGQTLTDTGMNWDIPHRLAHPPSQWTVVPWTSTEYNLIDVSADKFMSLQRLSDAEIREDLKLDLTKAKHRDIEAAFLQGKQVVLELYLFPTRNTEIIRRFRIE
eukprot:TRINITY_DN5693_c0_g1_i1.p1 TRINITY_DN5693_c0_g1~~TRINITY_DN5693_c0_g1_i1.p1  ORF type:complete len:280 (-),score=26.98 TRINITY_DN5693_c0_g1_i1:39-878(-)